MPERHQLPLTTLTRGWQLISRAGAGHAGIFNSGPGDRDSIFLLTDLTSVADPEI